MAWNPQDFINRWNGKGLDIDGVASVQCVDAFKQCLKELGYPNPTRPIGGSGGAKEIWYRREALGYSKYFEFVQVMKFGDWCIWDSNLGGGYGHVAMFVSDNGNGTGKFFGQNQSYTNSPFDTVNISYAHTLGALRVKPEYRNEGFNASKLIPERGRAYFKNDVPITIHKNSPTGPAFGTFVKGEEQNYTEKYIGNGHRYISWLEPKYNNVRCFCAVSATEQRPAHGSDDEWATFGEYDIPQSKPEESKPKPPKKEFPESVKFKGIDISSHNKDIDISGQDFVIIRATYGTNTDEYFLRNVQKCKEKKIPFGIYCYDYALNDEQANEQPAYLHKLLKDNGIVPDLGVWFDMEDADGYKNKNGVLNKERCSSSCKIFCDYFSEKGYFTGVYSTKWWFENLCPTNYSKWVANWGTNDGTCQADFSNYAIVHQYTSIPIDKNVMYVDMDKLKSNPKEDVAQPDKPNSELPIFPEIDVDAMNKFFETWGELGERLLG